MELEMPEENIFIPFPRRLYYDIVRFSDGRIRPEAIAADQVEVWLQGSVDFGDQWGERVEEVAQIYAPDVYQRWMDEDERALYSARADNRPLIWKEVSIDAGSDVRMTYGGTMHFARVKRGRIVDEAGEFTPSEWASKVAGGTSRNAWRDLWFKDPMSKNWVAAQTLRSRASGAEG
jgi:hypothetical protein